LGSADDVPHWDVAQAARLSTILAENGVDWIEVTTGGLDQRQKIDAKPGYQVPYAAAVKKSLIEQGWLNVVVSTVGMITEAEQAKQITEDRLADAVAIGRGFLKNPGEFSNFRLSQRNLLLVQMCILFGNP
jgi:2,4-dienoyl-CoA reductase-like NADH-dependent reductase (Old Yellow Enzyme family)